MDSKGFKGTLPRYYKERIYNRVEKDLIKIETDENIRIEEQKKLAYLAKYAPDADQEFINRKRAYSEFLQRKESKNKKL